MTRQTNIDSVLLELNEAINAYNKGIDAADVQRGLAITAGDLELANFRCQQTKARLLQDIISQLINLKRQYILEQGLVSSSALAKSLDAFRNSLTTSSLIKSLSFTEKNGLNKLIKYVDKQAHDSDDIQLNELKQDLEDVKDYAKRLASRQLGLKLKASQYHHRQLSIRYGLLGGFLAIAALILLFFAFPPLVAAVGLALKLSLFTGIAFAASALGVGVVAASILKEADNHFKAFTNPELFLDNSVPPPSLTPSTASVQHSYVLATKSEYRNLASVSNETQPLIEKKGLAK